MNKYKMLFYGCQLLFLALCLLHYFSQRPLWLDEDFVYQNILRHDYAALFGPLDPVQSFPRLQLIAVKALAAAFGDHVLVLRLFSLIAMLAAFVIWARLLRADSRNDLLAALALFAIAASYRFSYYAAELKPYAMDVLVVAVFALYVHYQRVFEGMAPRPRDHLLAALLPLLIFFSYAGLFVFWIVPWNFLLQMSRNRKAGALLLTSTLACAACLTLFYFLDVRHSITQPGLDYWDGHFVCYDSWRCFWDKFGDGTRRMVIYPFEGNTPLRYAGALFIPFAMFALFWYGSRRMIQDGARMYHLDSLALLLYLELFALGSAQLYPFTGERLTLFFSPFVIYMAVKGLGQMVQWPKGRIILLSYFGVFYLLCLLRTIMKHLHYY